MKYDVFLDATELKCPLPLVHAKKKLNEMKSGEILKITTRDPSSIIDFKTYASVSGHTLLKHEECDHIFYFYIQKGEQLD